MARSIEREHAFIMIFEQMFRPDLTLDEIAELAADAEVFEAEPFAVSLAATVGEHRDEADALIAPRLRNWTLDRLAAETLAVLRLGVCEMFFAGGATPVSVCINECVELAKTYCPAKDAGFVNGVLGAISRDKAAES